MCLTGNAHPYRECGSDSPEMGMFLTGNAYSHRERTYFIQGGLAIQNYFSFENRSFVLHFTLDQKAIILTHPVLKHLITSLRSCIKIEI